MSKPRKLQTWVVTGDFTAEKESKRSCAIGTRFTIAGVYEDRWFDPYVRRAKRIFWPLWWWLERKALHLKNLFWES